MKISTRLSVSISIIASIIFIAFGLTVYLFSSKYRADDFHEKLKERVVITEKIFLEKESFAAEELEKIMNQFLHTLPEETEEVVALGEHATPSFKYEYPQHIQQQLIATDALRFNYAQVQGASATFNVKGNKYLIIVTAVDRVGIENLSFLQNIILLLVSIVIPLFFISSFLMTKRALLPISKKIDKANTIGASNLHQRLNVYNPNDELGKMAIAFNNLLDRLEASFESQKAFIRNASHEIRNPLTAIMGEAEIAISKARTNEEYKDSIAAILTESEKLNSTVNNLLQLSKVTAIEENIQREKIEFDALLKTIKESFDFQNPENQVELYVDHSTQKTRLILGNKNLLKTAIINLLDNACKFSSNSTVQVTLKTDDNWLILSVKDSGIGIEEQDLEKVKIPFFRGSNALKGKGSGIGLSLSSKIIELHFGELSIESKVDVGTEVQLKLPLIQS